MFHGNFQSTPKSFLSVGPVIIISANKNYIVPNNFLALILEFCSNEEKKSFIFLKNKDDFTKFQLTLRHFTEEI